VILADTSVWIDLLSKRPTLRLTEDAIPQLVTCAPVLQEVLQGVSDDIKAARVRRSLEAFPVLDDPLPSSRFLEAADIYRQGRRRGLTIRSSMDCLIAAIALQAKVTVWHRDRDFEAIAQFTALKTRR
jgi:predicted nucleic acid-binding protein